jgi:hypothetical protein
MRNETNGRKVDMRSAERSHAAMPLRRRGFYQCPFERAQEAFRLRSRMRHYSGAGVIALELTLQGVSRGPIL